MNKKNLYTIYKCRPCMCKSISKILLLDTKIGVRKCIKIDDDMGHKNGCTFPDIGNVRRQMR